MEIYPGFDTPYGTSAPFKLLRIGGKAVLRVAMHGIAYGDPSDPATAPWIAAKQVAWVCQAAGVERALVEGSVGGIQDPDQPGAPLGPWSVVITDDYMLFFRPPDDQPFVSDRKQISRLRDPFCSDLRKALLNAARNEPKFVSVHDHGVYLCSSFGRFETTAEIKAFAAAGAAPGRAHVGPRGAAHAQTRHSLCCAQHRVQLCRGQPCMDGRGQQFNGRILPGVPTVCGPGHSQCAETGHCPRAGALHL